MRCAPLPRPAVYFLAGKRTFQAGAVAGSLVNQGTLGTASGGRGYLIAPAVENHGVITSPSGEVILAAGRSLQLVDSDVPALRVVPSGAVAWVGRAVGTPRVVDTSATALLVRPRDHGAGIGV